MPKQKKQSNQIEEDVDVTIKQAASSLNDFVRRPVPTEEEVEEFEEIIEEEAREDEIEEGLNEIYQNDEGDTVDVSRLDVKNRRGFFYYLFSFIFFISLFVGAGYIFYNYFYIDGTDATAIEVTVEGQENVVAGEEFFTTIYYRNLSKVNIKNVVVNVNFGNNFIFLDSTPALQDKNSFWQFGVVPTNSSGFIKIKGKIINEKDVTNVILVKVNYMPENFSSEFKKEVSFTTQVASAGIDFDFDFEKTVLVGEENEITVLFNKEDNNYIDNFRLSLDVDENIDLTSNLSILKSEGKKEGDEEEKIKYLDTGVWEINNIDKDLSELIINYKIFEKLEDKQDINIKFEYIDENDQVFVFYKEMISLDVLNSDLNLTTIINGSKEDQGFNFEDVLNYSIVYNNKGETAMKDVVIMAILDSDFLDWTTLDDKNKGREKGNTITWSKEEIPELEEIAQNEEGVIDFSIKLLPFRETDLGKDFQVKSFAQYSIGNIEDFKENADNRSNEIINKINSDLSLSEQIRYFNDDNIPVGTGPLPPQVGEETSFKVYWTLTNNLHELRELQVEVDLPEYVNWSEKNRTSVGSVSYDSDNHKVIWKIGRLPITVYKADAEFSISFTPKEEDQNTIMVLLPGSKVNATDNETNEQIEKITRVKTSKLEDDEIANLSSDGRVIRLLIN